METPLYDLLKPIELYCIRSFSTIRNCKLKELTLDEVSTLRYYLKDSVQHHSAYNVVNVIEVLLKRVKL